MHIHSDEIEAMGPAALRTYFRIANAWQLDDLEQRRLLGDPLPATFLSWQDGDSLPGAEALQRITGVLGIYRALQVLFPDRVQADAWIRRANDASVFGGSSALDLMMSSGAIGIHLVQRHLEAQLHR